ncbi:MAG: protein-L-isoaspartate carboxylmethyltransferase, partial [Pseudonocardiaceae bacterium]
MTSYTATPWQKRASALADNLARRGILHSAVWRAALEQTPRHLFVSAGSTTSAPGLVAQEPSIDTS